MVLLARQDARSGSGDPFERLEESTRIKGFPHIALERATDADRPGEKELRAARTYFLGIAHVKEIFEKQRDVFKFNVTKRWIQSIFNHISNDESFVYGLTNIKNHDEYTLNHSVNVAVLSVALGRRLGLSRRELAELGVSAFLHDLGKLDIPKEILEKPSGLDSQEWAVMERHSHLGAERIIQIKAERGIPNRAVQVAFEHHLKADLSGYPKFHRKRQLNFYSKIVKITDYFDAMTTTRVYRPRAYTREEALDIMLHLSGEEFDTLILKAFANMIGSHPVGSLVALDTGEIGIVFGLNDQAAFAQRPRVKLIADAGGKKFDGPEVELTETVPDGAVFKRTIVKTLDPEKYGLKIADYFLARVS
jgi:HD-GYP domain-containing protein (c-di-GMP phosphodiesterase class II)